MTKAGRGSDQFPLRLPEGLREQIKAHAEQQGRSMNAEIVARLEATLDSSQQLWDSVNRIEESVEKIQQQLNKIAPQVAELMGRPSYGDGTRFD